MNSPSYGIPLAVLTAATTASLFTGNKKLHLLCGTTLTALSCLHGWQYQKKLKTDLQRGVSALGISDLLSLQKTNLERFIQSVEISSFLPGRIRLHSKALVQNLQLQKQVTETLQGYKEISSIEINPLTGSVLIQYVPALLQKNPELARMELYIKNHSKGRK